ncbi:MAG: NAD-dependent epimerase/dehydratase family protein [Candidatus Dormibacteria bacterium]
MGAGEGALATLNNRDGFWRGRPVLVTGATGLLGSWLASALVTLEADVTVFVRDPEPASELYRSGTVEQVRLFQGELEDYFAVQRAVVASSADAVFHLGAQALVPHAARMPLDTIRSNVLGTANVLEACRATDRVTRLVVASTDKVYGEQGERYTESTPLAGSHPYDASKVAADVLARSYALTYGLPVALMRCGNLYGGGDLNWSRIVPGTIRSLLRGERPVVRSDGTPVRDYLYVQDAAWGYLDLARRLDDASLRGEAFNLSPESEVSVLEVVDLLRRLINRADLEPSVLGEASGEIQYQTLSSQRAREVLGWSPRWALEDALRETIAWYERYLSNPRRTITRDVQ